MNILETLAALGGAKERFESATVKVKQAAIKGLLARDAIGAMVTGSIYLVIGGTAYGLTTYIHPAAAAVVTGAGILLTISCSVYFATKSSKKTS